MASAQPEKGIVVSLAPIQGEDLNNAAQSIETTLGDNGGNTAGIKVEDQAGVEQDDNGGLKVEVQPGVEEEEEKGGEDEEQAGLEQEDKDGEDEEQAGLEQEDKGGEDEEQAGLEQADQAALAREDEGGVVEGQEAPPDKEVSPAIMKEDQAEVGAPDPMNTDEISTGAEGCPAPEGMSDSSPSSTQKHQTPIATVNGSQDSSLAIHCADMNQDVSCTTGEGEHGNMDSDGEFAAEAISPASGFGRGLNKSDRHTNHGRRRSRSRQRRRSRSRQRRRSRSRQRRRSRSRQRSSSRQRRRSRSRRRSSSRPRRGSSSSRRGGETSSKGGKESSSQKQKRSTSRECSISPSRKHGRYSSRYCRRSSSRKRNIYPNKDSTGSSSHPSSSRSSQRLPKKILGEMKDYGDVDLRSNKSENKQHVSCDVSEVSEHKESKCIGSLADSDDDDDDESEEAATAALGNSRKEEAKAAVTLRHSRTHQASAGVMPLRGQRDKKDTLAEVSDSMEEAGSRAPTPQLSSCAVLLYKGPTPVRVWVVGDSCVYRVKQSITAHVADEHLGFPNGIMNFKWFVNEDMRFEEVLPLLVNCSQNLPPPQILVIHVGGSDIGKRPVLGLAKDLKQDIEKILCLFPQVKIVWSQMIPCFNWQTAQAAALNRSRQKINKVMSNFVRENGGIFVQHNGLEGSVKHLYMKDGVHPNVRGLDVFINELKEGVSQALALLDGESQPNANIFVP